MYQLATQVESPGPPSVMARISSKTMNEKTVRRTRSTTTVGNRSGSVIDQNRRPAPAPSTSAASKMPGGMLRSAAWNRSTANGVVRQT